MVVDTLANAHELPIRRDDAQPDDELDRPLTWLRCVLFDPSDNSVITSLGGGGGGSGTEYTEGDAVSGSTDGGAILFNNSGTWAEVTEAVGLPVNVVGGSAAGTEYTGDDAGAVASDGPFVLGLRQDSDASPVSADGDFHPFVFDDEGRLKVRAAPVYTVGFSTPAAGFLMLAKDGSGTGRSLIVSGDDLKITLDGERAGTNPISGQTGVQGNEGTITALTQRVTIATDDDAVAHLATLAGAISGSEVQVDVVSSALPSGAATEATLGTIDADTSALALCVAIKADPGSDTARGLRAIARRRDTDTAPTGVIDGDEQQLITDSIGALKCSLPRVRGITGNAASTTKSGLYVVGRRQDSDTPVSGVDDGDFAPFITDSVGALKVSLPRVAGSTGSAGSDTQRGLSIVARRKDSDTVATGVDDGDYAPILTGPLGGVKVESLRAPGSVIETLVADIDATTLSDPDAWTTAITNSGDEELLLVKVTSTADFPIEVAYNDAPTDTDGVDVDDFIEAAPSGGHAGYVLDLKTDEGFINTNIELRRYSSTPTEGRVRIVAYYRA